MEGIQIAPPLPPEVPRTAGKPPRPRPTLLELPLLPWEMERRHREETEAAEEQIEVSALTALQAIARSRFHGVGVSSDDGAVKGAGEGASDGEG